MIVTKRRTKVGRRSEFESETRQIRCAVGQKKESRSKRSNDVELSNGYNRLDENPRDKDCHVRIAGARCELERTQYDAEDVIVGDGFEYARRADERAQSGRQGDGEHAGGDKRSPKADRLHDVVVVHEKRTTAGDGEEYGENLIDDECEEAGDYRAKWNGSTRLCKIAGQIRPGHDSRAAVEQNAEDDGEIGLLSRRVIDREIRHEIIYKRISGKSRIIIRHIADADWTTVGLDEKIDSNRQGDDHDDEKYDERRLGEHLGSDETDEQTEDENSRSEKIVPAAAVRQRSRVIARFDAEADDERFDDAENVDARRKDVGEIEDDADRAAEFGPERATNHEVGAAAANCAVRRYRGD